MPPTASAAAAVSVPGTERVRWWPTKPPIIHPKPNAGTCETKNEVSPVVPNIIAVQSARFERRRTTTNTSPAPRIARNPAMSPASREATRPDASVTVHSRPGGQSAVEVSADVPGPRLMVQKSLPSSDESPAAAKTMKTTARARRGVRRRA